MQYLLPRHLGIALRGGHTGMAEHGADGFERHAALQHKGGKGVARHVQVQPLAQVQRVAHDVQVAVDGAVVGHLQPARGTGLQLGQFVKQGERGGSESHHSLLPRFVTWHGEPRAAAVALNVLRGQVFQVDIGQPRVRRKHKQIAQVPLYHAHRAPIIGQAHCGLVQSGVSLHAATPHLATRSR